MKCYWWNRWWHRKSRESDMLFLLPAIRMRAEMTAAGRYSIFTKEYDNEVNDLTYQLFEIHKNMPGQGHWHCECSNG